MKELRRLGLFGGTFNPPHIAHLIGAQLAAEQLRLDKLIFIPTNIPPHKSSHDIAVAADRLAMTRLAVRGNPLFDVSDIETRREGKSYTIDTIREIRSTFDPEELHLLIGLDMLAIFDSWRDSDAILRESKLAVMLRPGNDLADIPASLRLEVEIVKMPQLDISSTIIRERIENALPIDYFVPEAVGAYIEEHHLYRD